MKAYNIPTDELHINSNAGEELVSITPEKAVVKNLDISSVGITATATDVNDAVAKAETIPNVTAENSGEFLRVNADGKIEAQSYPIISEETIYYNQDVTTPTGDMAELNIPIPVDYEDVTIVFNGVHLIFLPDDVVYEGEVDNLIYECNIDSESHSLESCGVWDTTAENYIGGTFSLKVSKVSTSIDENFKNSVIEVAEDRLLPTVTSSDNGKTIAVDGNGEWKLVDNDNIRYSQIDFTCDSNWNITSITGTYGIIGQEHVKELTLAEAHSAISTGAIYVGGYNGTIGFGGTPLNPNTSGLVVTYMFIQAQITSLKIENVSINFGNGTISIDPTAHTINYTS